VVSDLFPDRLPVVLRRESHVEGSTNLPPQQLLTLVTGIRGRVICVPTTFLTQVSQQVRDVRIAEAMPIGRHARTAIAYFRRDILIIHGPSGH
jgi:hypothetical protein